MKTSFFIILLSISSLFFSTSCKKASPSSPMHPLTPVPVACVTALTYDTVYVSQSITFSSCTQGATSYLWNYGDNTSNDTASVVTHSYSAAGTYMVTFTASNPGGHSAPKIFTIVVLNAGFYTFRGMTTNVSTFTCHPDAMMFFEGGNLSIGDANLPACVNADTIHSGGYPVVNSSGNGVYNLSLSTNTQALYTSFNSGSSQLITITTSGNNTHGTKTMSGANIMLVNRNNLSDSGSVPFSMTYFY